MRNGGRRGRAQIGAGPVLPVHLRLETGPSGGSVLVIGGPGLGSAEGEGSLLDVFELLPVALFMFDRDLRFSHMNQGFSRLMGCERGELTGSSFIDIAHPDEVDRTVTCARRLLAGEIRAMHLDSRWLGPGDDDLWVRLSASALLDDFDAPMYGVGVVESIDDLKRLERRGAEPREVADRVLAPGLPPVAGLRPPWGGA